MKHLDANSPTNRLAFAALLGCVLPFVTLTAQAQEIALVAANSVMPRAVNRETFQEYPSKQELSGVSLKKLMVSNNQLFPSRESLRSSARLESLIKKLRSSNDVERTHAATDLSFLDRPAREVVPALQSALLSDSSKWVRRAAARSLGKIGSQLARAALISASSDRDKWVAHSAQNALMRLSGSK